MAAIKKHSITVQLDGPLPEYAGESVELWTNYPRALAQQLQKLVSDAAVIEFIGTSGVILAHTFTDEAGAPLAADALPWPVYFTAFQALVDDYVKKQTEIRKAFEKKG